MSGGGSRLCDPSKLDLKKELTQIRKAARVLRDPGTSSTWKSPLSSARSAPLSGFHSNQPDFLNRHFRPCGNNNDDDDSRDHMKAGNLESPHQFTPRVQGVRSSKSRSNDNSDNNNDGIVREDRVFLYNWRTNSSRSLSGKSLRRLDSLDGDSNDAGPSVSAAASATCATLGSSTSNVGNDDLDSKSDSHVDDHILGHCYSGVFRCGDTKLGSLASTIKIGRAMSRKKFKKVSSTNFKLKRTDRRWALADKQLVNSVPGTKYISLRPPMSVQDGSVSLMENSDGTDEYYNSEDMQHVSAVSPLLSGVRQKKFPHSSAKFVQGSLTDDSSYSLSTPALSMSSYKRYFYRRNHSIIGPCDGTVASSLDMEDETDDLLDLPAQQGCGMPCYWSKRSAKLKEACRSCCSPSLTKSLRRQGTKLVCGCHKVGEKHHNPSSYSDKNTVVFRAAQSHVPLLVHDGEALSVVTRVSDDEASMNFEELTLEALSSLDERKWSFICKSHEQSELTTVGADIEEENLSENNRSWSQRYRPMFFDELIGQHVIVQSLMNAVTKGKVAPVYLFHGPRGTGKTSAANVFAAALHCLANDVMKPCGICKECIQFTSGKSKGIIEVDGSSKKETERVKYLLKSLSVTFSSPFTGYKVFVIEECHLLPSKTWLAFHKFLDEPLPRVVFILITSNLDNVPGTVLSRCQKYLFNKIRDHDILSRLHKISIEEKLDVESDALELIAQHADGSLQDAETMLDQLSLLGKKVTTSLVNEFVGIVSDEKLLELLENAMASNTAETVKRARELLDSGADPLALMSQLASLIMDIITGVSQLNDARGNNTRKCLTDAEMQKLKHALKLLSEAEKQLRISSERSTGFTATLLQLGSFSSPELTLSESSWRLSSKTSQEDPSTASGGAEQGEKYEAGQMLHRKTASSTKKGQQRSFSSSPDTLDNVWVLCIERCHSKTLRQLLLTHGKLVSLSEVDGVLVACIAFRDEAIKSRAEGFMISITSSMEKILNQNVVVRIVLLPDGMNSISAELTGSLNSVRQNLMQPAVKIYGEENISSKSDSCHELLKVSGSGFNGAEGQLISSQKVDNPLEVKQESPLKRLDSLISEERLETAWLQAAEKGTPRSMARLRPEINQVLPQGSIYSTKQLESRSSMDSYYHEDVLNNEIKILKVDKSFGKDQTGERMDSHHISPSLLHQNSFSGNLSKEYQGYQSETSTGRCNMFFCWSAKPQKGGKMSQRTSVRMPRGRPLFCFGDCRKSRHGKFEKEITMQ